MNAPINIIAHQVVRIYEVFDRDTRVVLGKVEVPSRDKIASMHPWTIEYMKDATEATNSRTGVRFVGERITRKGLIPAQGNRHLHMRGMSR
jgi:hypothetical protein